MGPGSLLPEIESQLHGSGKSHGSLACSMEIIAVPISGGRWESGGLNTVNTGACQPWVGLHIRIGIRESGGGFLEFSSQNWTWAWIWQPEKSPACLSCSENNQVIPAGHPGHAHTGREQEGPPRPPEVQALNWCTASPAEPYWPKQVSPDSRTGGNRLCLFPTLFLALAEVTRQGTWIPGDIVAISLPHKAGRQPINSGDGPRPDPTGVCMGQKPQVLSRQL